MTDRFASVPPEVLQILTKSPPYTPGEKMILQAYVTREGANPEIAFSINHLLGGQSSPAPAPPSSDFGIPGLDIPDNIAGIGLPTLDFMQGGGSSTYAPSEPSAFHQDLKHQGATDINFDRMNAASPPPGNLPGVGTPTADFLTPAANLRDWMTPEFPEGGGSDMPSARGPSTGESPTSLTAMFGAPTGSMSRSPDATPAGSNTMTQGAGNRSPGTVVSTDPTDWKSEAAKQQEYDYLGIDPNSDFYGIRSDQVARVAANPEIMAEYLYPDAPLTQAGQTEWLQNVLMLSKMGLLTDVPNATIFTKGPEGAIGTMEQVEAMKKSMPEFNAEIDPRSIYREAMTRLLNSDATQFQSEDYGQGTKGDAENQVAVTNGMLAAVKPFIYAPQQEAYVQSLNRAGMQYLSEVAASRTSLSYPEWLKSQGAMDWL